MRLAAVGKMLADSLGVPTVATVVEIQATVEVA